MTVSLHLPAVNCLPCLASRRLRHGFRRPGGSGGSSSSSPGRRCRDGGGGAGAGRRAGHPCGGCSAGAGHGPDRHDGAWRAPRRSYLPAGRSMRAGSCSRGGFPACAQALASGRDLCSCGATCSRWGLAGPMVLQLRRPGQPWKQRRRAGRAGCRYTRIILRRSLGVGVGLVHPDENLLASMSWGWGSPGML